MNVLIALVLMMSSIVVEAGDYSRPSRAYESVDLLEYRWIYENSECRMHANTNSIAESIISKITLEKYLKLKMRNFVKDISLNSTKVATLNSNYLDLKLELYEYNDQLDIYYGLITFQLLASVNSSEAPIVDIYKLTLPIAGSDEQIVKFIKEKIDSPVELFAEDYYYIEDIIKAQKVATD